MTVRKFRAFVDRIDGDKAVLLLGEKEQHEVILPLACLPDRATEGAVLTVTMRYEPKLTAEASEQASALIRKLSK